MIKSKMICLFWMIFAFGMYMADTSYWMAGLLVFSFAGIMIEAIITFISGKKLEIEIKLPYSVQKADAFQGTLQIQNNSYFPVFSGSCVIGWENYLTGEKGEKILYFSVSGKKTEPLHFEEQFDLCGLCGFYIKSCKVFDPFKLFGRKAKRVIQKNSELFVIPEIWPVDLQLIGKEAYDMESFRYSQEYRGDDPGETFEIREYMFGDNVKQIHWKLSEKLGKSMVRESSYPVFDSVLLLVDFYRENPSSKTPQEMDALAEIFVSAAMGMAAEGIPFEVGFFEERQKRFYLERIKSEEDCMNVTTAAIQACGISCQKSAAEFYLEEAGERSFACCMYITARDAGEETEILSKAGNVICIRCKQEFEIWDQGITFSAAHWKDEIHGVITR